MTIYKITTEDGVVYAEANLAEASAGVQVYFGSDPGHRGEADDDGFSWRPVPLQTADARHHSDELGRVVAEYCEMGAVLRCEALA